MIPDTLYARTADDAYVAYQVVGDGPDDIVFSPGWFSNLDLIWEHPEIAPFLRGLAASSRLILFDRRGTGLSDPVSEAPDLDTMMEDVRAVMDAAGSERAVLIGISISAAVMSVFAATFPDRALGLVMIHALPRVAWSPDYPWGETLEFHRAETDHIAGGWGTGRFERWFLGLIGDPRAEDHAYVAMTARYLRGSMSPGTALIQDRAWYEVDSRHVLPAIHVPTLVVNRRADSTISRNLADMIPGAEMVDLPDDPRPPWIPGSERTVAEIQRFIAGIREEEGDLDRVLATVLFTDVVGSTKSSAEVGDARWRESLAEHNRAVRAQLARYRGREIKTMGDGFLATFDGPARAIRAARAIARSVEPIGVRVRQGLHTGECTFADDDVSGIAVVIAARVMALAGPGEVLVSGTVKDLVAGSGIGFEDRGEHELKGVPGMWRLFAAVLAG